MAPKTPAIKPTFGPPTEIQSKLQPLKAAIVEHPPFCFGTIPVNEDDLVLFYKKDDPLVVG